MGFDFHRLLEDKYPGYDRNHPRYKYGDILQIDGIGEAIFLENWPVSVKCLIIKKSFGLEVGIEAEVPYDRITAVSRGKDFDGILWKPGYIVEEREDKFILLEWQERHWHALCVDSPNGSAYPGSCYYLCNPYEDYIVK